MDSAAISGPPGFCHGLCRTRREIQTESAGRKVGKIGRDGLAGHFDGAFRKDVRHMVL